MSLKRFFAICGPGLVVMLADTDAGSLITAAQSGAKWGYRLLLLQVLLIPILYMVQELTLRLGLVTGKGHGELISEHFGKPWALLSVSTLAVACVGALITQLVGLAGVAQIYHIPVWLAMIVIVGLILFMVITGSYRSVEKLAIIFGLVELVFLLVAWKSAPQISQIWTEARQIPLYDHGYLYLVAANIGAVIMPWMVFYQQSAVLDKGLRPEDLKLARLDTAFGAVLTQVIMMAVLIAVATTLGRQKVPVSLEDVPQIANSLTPFLGSFFGKLAFSLGMTGAALIATIVVCLTASWGIGEVFGYKRSLTHPLKEAPIFYGVFAATLIAGAILVVSGVNLVALSVAVEAMNALLLPIVLGFLYLLAVKTLPEPYRLKGPYAVIVGIVMAATTGFGVFAAIVGFLGS